MIQEDLDLVDCEGEYRCYHYKTGSFENPEYKGIITDKDSNVLCSSFGLTPLLLVGSPEYNELVSNNFNNLVFYKSYEGTLLRVWFHNNLWHISTHRKIDAYNSVWYNDKSFGELFEQQLYQELKDKIEIENTSDLLDVYFSKLDTNKIYSYLLSTNDNTKIVCNPFNKLYFVGEFIRSTNPQELCKYTTDNTSLLSRPEELKFNSELELQGYLDTVNVTESMGVIVYNINDGKINTSKIVTISYADLYMIKNNCFNIKLRYLQLRNTFGVSSSVGVSGNSLLLDKFKNIHKNGTFDKYEQEITEFLYKIYNIYTRRYMNGEYVYTVPVIHNLLKFLFEWYKYDMTIDALQLYINGLPGIILYRYLKIQFDG